MDRQGLASVLIITALCTFAGQSVSAETFCVSTSAELQNALTEAVGNGQDDFIQIVEGIYEARFIYTPAENQSLTVEGGYDINCFSKVLNPANTIVDSKNNGTVFVFYCPDKNADITVRGISIQNGKAIDNNGGGVYILTAGNVSFSYNVVINNTTNVNGGGVYVLCNGNISFSNNTIVGNKSSNSGGGTHLESRKSDIIFCNNIIENNTACNEGSCGSGGGIYANTSGEHSTLISGSIINGNQAASGGGAYVVRSSKIIKNSLERNSASVGGGLHCGASSGATTELCGNFIHENTAHSYAGILIADSAAYVNDNIIANNVAGRDYGGAGIGGSPVMLANNLVINNESVSGNVGGISVASNLSIILVNNSIAYNNAKNGYAGGIRIWIEGEENLVSIYNNIIYSNKASIGQDVFLINDGDNDFIATPINILNNNFDQSSSGTYIEIPFTIDPSNLNNENPLFVDPSNGDYHLQSGSPCIDKGSNAAPNLPLTDIEGKPRIMNQVVDMGAYEYPGIVSGRAIPGVLQLLLLNSGG